MSKLKENFDNYILNDKLLRRIKYTYLEATFSVNLLNKTSL